MRSTMTRYSASSFILVPPSLTNSAATPSALPSWFTRARNAGGKLYSRPQRRPTFFIMCSQRNSTCGVTTTEKAAVSCRITDSIHSVHRGGPRLHHSAAVLFHKVFHDSLQVARFLIDAELPLGAGALVQNGVHILDGAAAPQLIDRVSHEPQQLGSELAHGHFRLFAKVDQLAFDPVACRAPLVLFDERATIQPETHVSLIEPMQLDDDRLGERGDGHGLFHLRGHVAHPELQVSKSGMRPDIPPDFFPVVDAVQLDQQIYEILVSTPGFKLLRHAGAREAPEDRRAERFQPGVASHPKRGARRERQQVREEIPHHVHHVDGGLL